MEREEKSSWDLATSVWSRKKEVCKARSTQGPSYIFCRSRQDNPERSEAPMDFSTDPDPIMDVQQAHVRNMRSKCRCSCVLQFTLRHGVSSVLHRPPSQMIHCIVLGHRISSLHLHGYGPPGADSLPPSCKRVTAQVEIIWTSKLPPYSPLGLASDIAKPYQVRVKQRSCADVNSPYKRKCWTNSGGPLVNSLLW
jgi:hypothetical protein